MRWSESPYMQWTLKLVMILIKILRPRWQSNIMVRARDYGGSDYGFKDQMLDEYFVVDLGGTYNLWNTYSLDFQLINLFDKEYEQAFLYQGPPRELNIGLRKSF